MRKILQTIPLVLFFAFVFFGTIATTAHAADINAGQNTIQPSPTLNPFNPFENNPAPTGDATPQTPTFDDQATFTTDPTVDKITAATPVIHVTFSFPDFDSSQQYVVCTGNKACFSGLTAQTDTSAAVPKIFFGKYNLFPITDKPKENKLQFDICGGLGFKGIAPIALSIPCKTLSGDPYNIKTDISKASRFLPGKVYSFSVGTMSDTGGAFGGGVFLPKAMGFFYVPISYPKATISPDSGLVAPSTIKVTLDPKDQGGQDVYYPLNLDSLKDDEWKNHNYQVTMTGGSNYKGIGCIGWNPYTKSTPLSVTFDNIPKGSYTIYVKDQTDEDDLHSLQYSKITSFTAVDVNAPGIDAFGLPTKPAPGSLPGCEGNGFIYYRANCVVKSNLAPDSKGKSCTPFARDPKGDEYIQFLNALNDLSTISKNTKQPCGNGDYTQLSTNCKVVDTAIGPIDVSTPEAFIKTIFQFALVIAAFGGVILIIVAGYILMTSSGDKEKVKGAGEMLSSAIVGLLFIVLSIVILEIIGVDLLRLPGFGH